MTLDLRLLVLFDRAVTATKVEPTMEDLGQMPVNGKISGMNSLNEHLC